MKSNSSLTMVKGQLYKRKGFLKATKLSQNNWKMIKEKKLVSRMIMNHYKKTKKS